MLELLVVGGWVMFVLFGVSVFAMTLTVLKTIEFMRLRKAGRRTASQILSDCAEHGYRNVLSSLERGDTPFDVVAAEVLRTEADGSLSEEEKQARVALIGSDALRRVETGIGAVSVAAHLSPLLGLLGTVTGMITAFQGLEHSGLKADPSLLAGGIWEALLTTAYGLIIAIPTMAIYFGLDSFVDKLAHQLKLFANDLQLGLREPEEAVQATPRRLHSVQ